MVPESLRELVQRFRVCWEVWPEYGFVNSQMRQIGLALELCGTHETGAEDVLPCCQHCHHVYSGLHKLADHILPQEERPSRYDISGYDQAIHYAPTRRRRAEVTLTIRIYHRVNVNDPLGDCQIRCLEDMKRRLKTLGASEGRFKNNH